LPSSSLTLTKVIAHRGDGSEMLYVKESSHDILIEKDPRNDYTMR